MMEIQIIILLASLLVLIKSSDVFVEAVSRLAKSMGISELMIGLTVVAIGTSLPELATGIFAMFNQSSDIAIGNVIGSNIANIALVLGLAAIVKGVKIEETLLRRDSYLMLFAVIILLFASANSMISLTEGIIFLWIFSAYILFLVESVHSQKETVHIIDFYYYFTDLTYFKTITRFLKTGKEHRTLRDISKESLAQQKNALVAIIALAVIIVSADQLVKAAIEIAAHAGVSQNFIGLTLIAIGTSLPELSVSLSAVIKKHSDIAIGNIIGSNITNILLILGLGTLVNPIRVLPITINVFLPYLLGVTLLLIIYLIKNKGLGLKAGISLLAVYLGFLILAINVK